MGKSGLLQISSHALKQQKLAEQYLGQRKLSEAIAACKAALKLKPNSVPAYKTMGNALLLQGDLVAASVAYHKIVSIQPDSEAFANLGLIAARQEQWVEAINLYGKALALKPDQATIHWMLGEVLIRQEYYNEGLSSQAKALELKPDLVGAEGYNNLASGLAWQGRLEEAIAFYQKSIQIKPNHTQTYTNLGNALYQFGREDEAIATLQKAIQIQPDRADSHFDLGLFYLNQSQLEAAIATFNDVIQLQPSHADAHFSLGTALAKQNRLSDAIASFIRTVELVPNFPDAHFSLGVTLLKQGKFAIAIDSLQQAIQFKPTYSEAYFHIGIALAQQGRTDEAIMRYQQAIQFQPDYAEAYWYLTIALGGQTNPNFPLLRQTVDAYIQQCQSMHPVQTKLADIIADLKSGLTETRLDRLTALEAEIQTNCDRLSKQEIDALYSLLFNLPYLRDDVAANAKTSKLIGNLYTEKIIQVSAISYHSSTKGSRSRSNPTHLKIGFLSQHFRRHPIGWCSIDVLRELSQITPNLNLYATAKTKDSDLRQQFNQVASKFWEGSFIAEEIAEQIRQDQIDVLIDLDSTMTPLHAQIFAYNPAPICLSWLGCDAPFMSSENYYLCDRYTHPDLVEPFYTEKLVRMPDSHMAVSGFPLAEDDSHPPSKKRGESVESLRRSLGIAPEQLIYLCVAPGHKFSPDLAKAQVQILSRVPNSILIHKGKCDPDVVKAIYFAACEAQLVDSQRILFLPLTKTEEEHRLTYLLADVVLDSYPYNGGSHNVEALWFKCPIVTLVGSQYSCRLGYSFLQTLGIASGISQNWDGYVTWGTKFGLDADLRNSVKEQLSQSQQPETLSPLWNPQKFAQDLYAILENLDSNA